MHTVLCCRGAVHSRIIDSRERDKEDVDSLVSRPPAVAACGMISRQEELRPFFLIIWKRERLTQQHSIKRDERERHCPEKYSAQEPVSR